MIILKRTKKNEEDKKQLFHYHILFYEDYFIAISNWLPVNEIFMYIEYH